MEFISPVHSVHCSCSNTMIIFHSWCVSSIVIDSINTAWSLGHNLNGGLCFGFHTWRKHFRFFHVGSIMSKISCTLSWFESLFWHSWFSMLGSWDIAEINLGVKHKLLLVKIDRIMSLFFENMFIHRSQSSLIFFEFVMSIWRIKLAKATRLKLAKIDWLIVLLR